MKYKTKEEQEKRIQEIKDKAKAYYHKNKKNKTMKMSDEFKSKIDRIKLFMNSGSYISVLLKKLFIRLPIFILVIIPLIILFELLLIINRKKLSDFVEIKFIKKEQEKINPQVG